MPNQTLEERISALERRVDELTRQDQCAENPWWERHIGAFKDSPLFDEAMRLGAEYRRSQPTAADEQTDEGFDVPA